MFSAPSSRPRSSLRRVCPSITTGIVAAQQSRSDDARADDFDVNIVEAAQVGESCHPE
jgi:hypothetical protein